MKEKNTKFKINKLHLYAIKAAEADVTDEELRKINLTDDFYDEYSQVLKNGEIWNAQINGLVASGKSTVAMQLSLEGQENVLGKKWNMFNIARDQIEFTRKVLDDDDLHDEVMCIDEWNAMSATGENATTEQRFMEYYSDIQAQKHIHRWSCSPQELIDKNANIILEVLAQDKINKITRCLLRYRIISMAQSITQLIGYVDINVTQVLAHPTYQLYRRKKFEKMSLVTKEGVRDLRELENAHLITEILPKLTHIAKYKAASKGVIRIFLEEQARKDTRFLSIITSHSTVEKIEGFLSTYNSESMLKTKLNKYRVEAATEKIIQLKTEAEMRIKEVAHAIGEIQAARQSMQDYWKNLLKIKEQYDNIDEDETPQEAHPHDTTTQKLNEKKKHDNKKRT